MAKVEGLVDSVALGPLTLKGFTHPVPAFELGALKAAASGAAG